MKAARPRTSLASLASLLGLWEPPAEHSCAPYTRLAREWRDSHMAQLSATVGGGEVGPGPASVVSSAALQLGASRWLADTGAKAGDAKTLLDASRLANDSRQNLLAAHELAPARPQFAGATTSEDRIPSHHAAQRASRVKDHARLHP